jgi:hypothetical protein
VGVVDVPVAMFHDTFVVVSLSQLGSEVGSVALPTVMPNVTVELSKSALTVAMHTPFWTEAEHEVGLV